MHLRLCRGRRIKVEAVTHEMNLHLISYFNWTDCSIVGIVAFSVIISFFRGFLRETVSIATWLLAIIIAIKFIEPAQLYWQPWIASPFVRYAVDFTGLFLSAFIIGVLINVLIHVLIKKTSLSLVDRLLGIFFGIGRGFLIVAVLLMFVSVESIKDNALMKKSQLAPKFQPIVSWLNKFLPSQFKHFSHWLVNQPIKKGNQ